MLHVNDTNFQPEMQCIIGNLWCQPGKLMTSNFHFLFLYDHGTTLWNINNFTSYTLHLKKFYTTVDQARKIVKYSNSVKKVNFRECKNYNGAICWLFITLCYFQENMKIFYFKGIQPPKVILWITNEILPQGLKDMKEPYCMPPKMAVLVLCKHERSVG